MNLLCCWILDRCYRTLCGWDSHFVSLLTHPPKTHTHTHTHNNNNKHKRENTQTVNSSSYRLHTLPVSPSISESQRWFLGAVCGTTANFISCVCSLNPSSKPRGDSLFSFSHHLRGAHQCELTDCDVSEKVIVIVIDVRAFAYQGVRSVPIGPRTVNSPSFWINLTYGTPWCYGNTDFLCSWNNNPALNTMLCPLRNWYGERKNWEITLTHLAWCYN